MRARRPLNEALDHVRVAERALRAILQSAEERSADVVRLVWTARAVVADPVGYMRAVLHEGASTSPLQDHEALGALLDKLPRGSLQAMARRTVPERVTWNLFLAWFLDDPEHPFPAPLAEALARHPIRPWSWQLLDRVVGQADALRAARDALSTRALFEIPYELVVPTVLHASHALLDRVMPYAPAGPVRHVDLDWMVTAAPWGALAQWLHRALALAERQPQRMQTSGVLFRWATRVARARRHGRGDDDEDAVAQQVHVVARSVALACPRWGAMKTRELVRAIVRNVDGPTAVALLQDPRLREAYGPLHGDAPQQVAAREALLGKMSPAVRDFLAREGIVLADQRPWLRAAWDRVLPHDDPDAAWHAAWFLRHDASEEDRAQWEPVLHQWAQQAMAVPAGDVPVCLLWFLRLTQAQGSLLLQRCGREARPALASLGVHAV